MADFEKMKVEDLRALAREKLGPAGSRLRTKGELVDALRAAARAPARAGRAGTPAGAAGGRSRSPAGKPAGKPKGAPPRKARPAAAQASGRAGKGTAKAASRGKRAATGAAPERAAGKAGAAVGARAAKRAAPARKGEGMPDAEGYFVARVRGEDAVREAPRAMTEAGSDAPYPSDAEGVGGPTYEEGLGDLPWGYGDDAFVALPRDPKTAFLYWDHSRDTVARGFEGLDHPRAQLWLFVRAGDGWDRLRTVEFALESRGWYVHDLEPGRTYRAEIHAVARTGGERLVGRPSNEVTLPPVGPSPVVDDRFVRIPWDLPLGRLLGPGRPGGPFSDEARSLLARLSDWTRFAGATWGSAGGMGGRPFSPTSSPGGPPAKPDGGEER
jgi:hypothetical protein